MSSVTMSSIALVARDVCRRLARPKAIAELACVGIILIAATAAGPWLHHRFGGMAHWLVVLVAAVGAAWAALACDRIDRRAALLTIAIVGVAMRLLLLVGEPYLSTDIYRYVWDGRVQGAGINPYQYVPAAPELARLRDAAIYPNINRADYAPTIYPPVAQMFFWLVTRFGDSVLAMKLGMVAMEAVALAATCLVLARLSKPMIGIAAFAWHPLPVWEIAGSGHVDAVMMALLLVAIGLMLSARNYLAGVAAAAAVLVKPTAVLMLPVLWWRWDWKLPALVAATAALLYLPYLSVGTKVLGFAGGYLQEEELSHGTGFRFLLIAQHFLGELPAHAATVYLAAAGAVMLMLIAAAVFRTDRSASASVRWIAILLAAFLVLLTPHYPWYYLVLVPFLAVYPRSSTLWVLTVCGMQMYQEVPGEIMPDYVDRQVVFHGLVLLAICHDIWCALPARPGASIEKTTGDLPA